MFVRYATLKHTTGMVIRPKCLEAFLGFLWLRDRVDIDPVQQNSDGWELISHSVNQDNQSNGVTFHYLYFKREVV